MAPKPPPDEIYRCACGFEAPYYKALGHLHGAKKRPECLGPEGKPHLTLVANAWGDNGESRSTVPSTPGTPTPVSTQPERTVASAERDDGDEEADLDGTRNGAFSVFEYTGMETNDPEEIARRLLQQRQAQPPSDGTMLGGDGEWAAEFPPGPQSQAREVVYLPVVVRIMYDWFRANGWSQADGSLSAWVTDMVLCHWVQCMGKAVVVVDREEVGLNDSRS